jgi:DNA adenine methylase
VSTVLRAPFPWFGGKSRVASLVWDRFGDVPNYVEPFAGSLAVLLGRPGWNMAAGEWRDSRSRTETVNDLDCYLANFWRATALAPDEVARWADWPVNEADLLARHQWLVSLADFRELMRSDPHHFDAKVAGWWVWGQSAWIGSGWCAHSRVPDQLPHLGNAGMGVQRPNQKLPHLGDAGRGVQRPNQKLPHLGDAGRGVQLTHYFATLAARLERVRVACGSWDRVLGESVTWRHGATGVLLDPPYDEAEHTVDYAAGTGSVAAEVRAWALENGGNPMLRVALCGYAGEHDELAAAGWSSVAWKARGGYGSQSDGRGRLNANRERIWFSPHCLAPSQPTLFAAAGGAA